MKRNGLIIGAILVISFLAYSFSTVNKDQKVNAVSPKQYNIQQMIINKIPADITLITREIIPDGVKLLYGSEYLIDGRPEVLELEILKPNSNVKTLRTEGIGWWLPKAETKKIFINNVPVEISIQTPKAQDGKNPWIEMVYKTDGYIINAFSRDIPEDEFIQAMESIKETNQKLEDYGEAKRQNAEMTEVMKTIDLRDKNDIKTKLAPFEKKGWTIKETKIKGKANELKGVQRDTKNKQIDIFIGDGTE